MAILDKLADFIERICKGFLVFAFAVMTIVTIVEVIRRYIFGLSYPWSEELVRFLLVWTTFIGGSIAFRKGELVYLDLIHKKMSQKNQKILMIINNILIFIFLCVVIYFSTGYTLSKSIMLQKSTGLSMPMVIPYLSIPIGFTFMAIFCIHSLFKTFKELKEGEAV